VRAAQPRLSQNFFLNENLLRFLTHDYGDVYGSGHQYPRGSALMMAFVMGAPWTLYALVHFMRIGRAKVRMLVWSDPSANFLFLGATVGVLFWCLARQLLFTYLLPMVPLFAAWLSGPCETTRRPAADVGGSLRATGGVVGRNPDRHALSEHDPFNRGIVALAHDYAAARV
jgi:hypothetical protein